MTLNLCWWGRCDWVDVNRPKWRHWELLDGCVSNCSVRGEYLNKYCPAWQRDVNGADSTCFLKFSGSGSFGWCECSNCIWCCVGVKRTDSDETEHGTSLVGSSVQCNTVTWILVYNCTTSELFIFVAHLVIKEAPDINGVKINRDDSVCCK